jgi:pimeloyl-ACP methyl ester carboxylesterase
MENFEQRNEAATKNPYEQEHEDRAMAFFENGGANIYYEDSGSGEAVIALHGLMENTLYWSLPGVAAALARRFRFISMDLRGTRAHQGRPERSRLYRGAPG